MKRTGRWCLVLTALALLSTAALAQVRIQVQPSIAVLGGSQLNLLTQKSVQEDLKMSEEQASKVTDLQKQQRDDFQQLRGLRGEERTKKLKELNEKQEKALKDLLKPEQSKRLGQIEFQMLARRGGLAVAMQNPQYKDQIKLTEKQQEQVKDLQQEQQQALRGLFQPGGNRQELQKKRQELVEKTNVKVEKILTDEQTATLKDLTGEPFKGELQPFRGIIQPLPVQPGKPIQIKPIQVKPIQVKPIQVKPIKKPAKP